MEPTNKQFAERLLVNAKTVFTNGSFEHNRCVAINGDRITGVPTDREWKSWVAKSTEVIDCDGGTILPGFVDAHCHPLAIALMHNYVDCKALHIRTLPDLAAAIKPLAGKGEWIRLANFPADLLDAMDLDCDILDNMTQSDPFLLVDDAGQTCVMNHEALRRTRINDEPVAMGTPHYDLNLKGIFKGNDRRVSARVPPLSEAEIEAGVKKLNVQLLAQGITTVHDTSWTNSLDTWHRFGVYKQSGILLPRVQMMAGVQLLDSFAKAGLCSGDGDDQLCLGAAKIAVDEFMNVEQPDITLIEHFIKQAMKHNFQLSLHTGSFYMLEATLTALDNLHFGNLPLRWPIRFEHCPICPPDLWNKLQVPNRILVLQPALFYEFSESESELSKKGIIESWYPLKSLLKRGVLVALSSDAPLGAMNPLTGIYSICTRNTQNAGTVSKSESISLERAIDLYTRSGADLYLHKDNGGRIATGMKADLVLMDKDFSGIDLEELLDSQVRMTIVGGKIVWQRYN